MITTSTVKDILSEIKIELLEVKRRGSSKPAKLKKNIW